MRSLSAGRNVRDTGNQVAETGVTESGMERWGIWISTPLKTFLPSCLPLGDPARSPSSVPAPPTVPEGL
ncbi:hypothetical protein PAL_GLEAN10001900 [Pteropus alecto]|uniref:Uncharacterized protein n=1 Tax=Pteropus alecto TaxID=9402 RepID=L5KPK1_PTEAL|nr:hypothetical protein PAL_GLEAN10001900 [Pteropus alecto]